MVVRRVLSSRDLPFSEVFPKREGQCAFCLSGLLPYKNGNYRKWCPKELGRDCAGEAWIRINALRGNSKYLRILCKQRDKEICRNCGVDCAKMERIIFKARQAAWDWDRWRRDRYEAEVGYYEVHDATMAVFKAIGFAAAHKTWEADHIVELRYGGTHDMQNMQTLCPVCHKSKTRNKGVLIKPGRVDRVGVARAGLIEPVQRVMFYG